MQRDFIELDKIGYEIKYNRSEKCYMVYFPEGLESIEDKIKKLGMESIEFYPFL